MVMLKVIKQGSPFPISPLSCTANGSFMTTIRQLLVGPGCLELTSKPDGSPVTAAAVGLRISDLTTAPSDPG